MKTWHIEMDKNAINKMFERTKSVSDVDVDEYIAL